MPSHARKKAARLTVGAVITLFALIDIGVAAGASAAPMADPSAPANESASSATSAAAPAAAAQVPAARPKADSVDTASYYRIINQSSGKCLTPWGTGDGTAVTQVVCNANDANQWWLLDTGSVGTISNYGTGKCLDLWGNIAADAQLVFTWSCYGANSQRWRPVNAGGQYFELHPYYTDKCLDLASSSGSDGAIIQQWGCHAFNNNQHWWLG